MRYKCCNCENFLVPQGPIQAFVTTQSGGSASLAQIKVQFDDDLKIKNLDKIRKSFTERESSKVIEIQFQEPLVGKLNSFVVKKYILSASKATIEIQCDNCKHLCQV